MKDKSVKLTGIFSHAAVGEKSAIGTGFTTTDCWIVSLHPFVE